MYQSRDIVSPERLIWGPGVPEHSYRDTLFPYLLEVGEAIVVKETVIQLCAVPCLFGVCQDVLEVPQGVLAEEEPLLKFWDASSLMPVSLKWATRWGTGQ